MTAEKWPLRIRPERLRISWDRVIDFPDSGGRRSKQKASLRLTLPSLEPCKVRLEIPPNRRFTDSRQ